MNRQTIRNTQHALRAGSWLAAAGLLLTGIGGAFLPWVWREPAALQLTGPGLAEFVKFLPDLRLLRIEIERLAFLLPLFLAMLALPLFAVNRGLLLPTWLRWLLRLAVFPLALAAISPVWKPGVLIAPEFRLQTLVAMIAVGLTVIAPWLKDFPLKILVGLWVIGGIAAIFLPIDQFSLTQPGISEAYDQTVHLGWGWWLTVVGMVMSIVGGLLAAEVDHGRLTTDH